MIRRIAGALFVLGSLALPAAAQPLVKSVSGPVGPGNTVLSGAGFEYHLAYNCSSTSGPCLNAEVVDLLPAGVVVDSTVPSGPNGDVALVQVTPNFAPGRTRVRFQMISPLPAGNSGDLTINVHFPNGSTPDGTVFANTADAINLETTPGTYTTPPVNVTAVVAENVTLSKSVTTAPLNLDMPETYRLRIANSNANGTLRIDAIGPVVDTLPPGAVFNGATPAADCQPGCVGTTPASVTWTAPCSVPLNPGANCDILVNVTFPSATFPSGTNVTNSFTADGTPLGEPPQNFGVGSDTRPVTTFVPDPGVQFEKNMLGGTPNPPTLNQTFSYEMIVTNNGNVPLDNIVVIDTVPVEFQTLSVTTGAYSGFADFAAGEGVRVSYEKNTALGVFTLWGSSPNTGTNTTLTSPPPLLGAGEYITRLRWEYGQASPGASASQRPRITGRIINPDNAGGPVAFGDTISNCADLTAVYTAGPTPVNENDCANFVLSGPFVRLTPAKDDPSGGPFNPGDNATWRLRVRSDSQSSDPIPLEDLIVSDLLPVNLTFVSWTFNANGTGLPAPQVFTQTPNFAGTGRTLLQWRWNAGSGSLGVNMQVFIDVTTSVREGAPAGTLANDMHLDSDSPALSLRCGSSTTDPLDLDGDGNTAETVCRDTGSLTVEAIAHLISTKTIKGTCDGSAVPSSAGTLIGGGIEYHLRVENDETVPMQNFVLIDILPHVGDTGVRDTSPRGSQWTPLLAAPIVPPSGTTLYYSTSGNPCRGEVGGPTTGCDPPNWTTVAPSPITSVRAFKLEFGDRVIQPADFLEFTFVMTTPGNVPPGDVAYNSFAYQADRADGVGVPLAAEPMKVGISIGSCDAASLGDYVWVDTNGDGDQNDGPTGLNGVYTQLFTPGPDGIPGTLDDVPLASTVTSNSPTSQPGWYSFPGLAPGNYFVRITPPPSYAISPRDAAGDTTDSDSDPNGASHVVTLDPNEDDPTIDFGLVPTAFGAAGDYVWFDANSDGIQNEPVTSGINGVTVHLYIDDGDGAREPGGDDLLVATTVTADDVYTRPGYYLFDGLVPGLPYFIQFVTPASAVGTTASNAGGDDTADSDLGVMNTTPVFSVAALELNPTFDAGFIGPTGTLALGDQVWADTDNDGVFEPENGEPGIDDVRLDLYRDVNSDGEPTLDEFAASAVTATANGFAGRYRFDDLSPGNYIVVVSPVNFTGGGALAGMSTSTGNDPAPDPDDDANGDDNGTEIGALVASRSVTLSDNGEPTSEDSNNDTNLTVDFGFILGGDPPGYDYGDAPDVGAGTAMQDYQTTALDTGARHLLGVPGAPFIGVCVDADGGFLQSVAAGADDATGSCSDDEDGVTFTGSFTPGGTATFNVTSGGGAPCSLDAWVDWNQNGDFDDAGEQIAASLNVPLGPPAVLSPAVPAGAIPGTTYARFRCTSGGGTTPTGEASDGEVEDYAIAIIGSDFGDAPASYGAAEHLVDPLAPLYLGACVDTEPAAQPSTGATGDDADPGTSRVGSCFDDESGVVQEEPLLTCETASFTITSNTAALLDAWIDFNGNGVFTDPGEQVVTGNPLVAGANARTIAVPCTATPGITYGRFRISSAGGQTPTSTANDGEVEDYAFNISGTDFGDAPDSYGTLVASNGARHLVQSGFSLGPTVDEEPDGQPSAGADGDGSDEDGVTLPALNACASAAYTVFLTNAAALNAPRLDAWVDFDGDGAFQDPRDRIASGVALAIGANNLNAPIPCDVRTRSTYARFRLSDGGIATPAGLSIPGEVEDYVAIVHGYDYGDAPPPHPVLAADDGARHIVLLSGNPTLGATTDTETDGQPSAGADGDGADEDGVTTTTLVAGTVGSITLTAGPTGGNVSCWIDFNDNGVWGDIPEDQVVSGLALPANTAASPTFPVPTTSALGTLALRCRITSASILAPVGSWPDGEVEDHLVTVIGYDLGDAPAPYPTLLASGGARHQVLPANNPTLGATVDVDGSDGHPSAAFDGDDTLLTDDEDGVTFPGVLLPASTGVITLTTGATGGVVSCWIDFDADGDWTDPGEQVVIDQPLGPNVVAPAGFVVPADAVSGTTGVRCRISTLGGLTPAGDAADGEVEDHAVIVGTVDFGDAPDSYSTTLAATGPRHGVVTGFSLGATIDAEADGQPSVNAVGDGADEDGVVLPATMTACTSTNITVTLTNTAAIATPLLNAWIDFDGSGHFVDPWDRIATDVPLTAGPNIVPVNVPCNAVTAVSYARFRLSSAGISSPTHGVDDGEVEDYVIQLQGLDFGDAIDPAYPTLLASNGARHVVLIANNPTLGPAVDTEGDATPNAAANGDDASLDDEDGVTFGPIIPGATGTVTVTTGATGGFVNVWIDFDHNGSWGDAGEHVVSDQALAGGASQQFTFPVPVAAIPGNAPLRARISSQTGLAVTGQAVDGEVEDHLAPVLAAEPRIGAALGEEERTPAGQCGTYDFVFAVRVQNLGNVTLTNVQATLPLASVFVPPATYSVTSVTSAELAVDPSYDGGAQPSLLLAGATLDPGESATIRVAFRLNAGCRDVTYQLSATATGQAPDGSTVTDVSQNGSDTDPDDDGSASDDNEPTPIVIAAFIDIPTVDAWALLLIAALLVAVALKRL